MKFVLATNECCQSIEVADQEHRLVRCTRYGPTPWAVSRQANGSLQTLPLNWEIVYNILSS